MTLNKKIVDQLRNASDCQKNSRRCINHVLGNMDDPTNNENKSPSILCEAEAVKLEDLAPDILFSSFLVTSKITIEKELGKGIVLRVNEIQDYL